MHLEHLLPIAVMLLQPPSNPHVKIIGKFLTATLLMAAGLSVTALGRQVTHPNLLLPVIAHSIAPVQDAVMPQQQVIIRFRANVDGISDSTSFLDACGGMLVILGLIYLKEGVIDRQTPTTQTLWNLDPYASTHQNK